MPDRTLVIHDVDLDLLDEQRKALFEVLFANSTHNKHKLGKAHIEALDGLLNMLDTWADERARIDPETARKLSKVLR